jgi:hypothetical protein
MVGGAARDAAPELARKEGEQGGGHPPFRFKLQSLVLFHTVSEVY